MKNKVLYAIVSLLVLTGCGSMKNMSREDRAGVGAQIGAFVGWLFGGAVGNSIDDDIGGDIGAFCRDGGRRNRRCADRCKYRRRDKSGEEEFGELYTVFACSPSRFADRRYLIGRGQCHPRR